MGIRTVVCVKKILPAALAAGMLLSSVSSVFADEITYEGDMWNKFQTGKRAAGMVSAALFVWREPG